LPARHGLDYAAATQVAQAAHMSPSPASEPDVPECLAVLGLRPPLTLEDVKQTYLAKAMEMHPDRGGDPAAFIRLKKAFEEANDYVRFKASKLEWLASRIDAYGGPPGARRPRGAHRRRLARRHLHRRREEARGGL